MALVAAGPITISQAGVDVRQADSSQLLFNSKYPFDKLDTQKPVSFQNIKITFAKDPPYVLGSLTRTLVYSFPHGYNYVPRTWVLFQNQGTINSKRTASYGYEDSIILSPQVGDYAFSDFQVDNQNVNFYVIKDVHLTNPDLTGYALLIRIYVFADSVGI